MTEKTSEVKKEKRTETKERKEQATKVKPVQPAQQPSLEEHKCLYHFGYLSQRSRKEKIPDECMTCEKIVQCMLKNVTG